jgi:uncharacterized repeat protein (TIGR04138 family)
MSSSDPEELLRRWTNQSHYPFQAVAFVRDAWAVASLDPSLVEDGHVTAAGLCRVVLELAVDEFRAEAEKTLRGWNVRSSEDVGAIVARLIEVGALQDSEADDARKFQGLFDLDRPPSDWLLQW